MKSLKLILLCSIIGLSSCSVDDDVSSPDLSYQFVAIDSVVAPDSLVLNQKNEFTVFYDVLSSCHEFSRFDFSVKGRVVKVTVINAVVTKGKTCRELSGVQDVQGFSFTPKEDRPYVFMFWSGNSEESKKNAFIEMTLEVW